MDSALVHCFLVMDPGIYALGPSRGVVVWDRDCLVGIASVFLLETPKLAAVTAKSIRCSIARAQTRNAGGPTGSGTPPSLRILPLFRAFEILWRGDCIGLEDPPSRACGIAGDTSWF